MVALKLEKCRFEGCTFERLELSKDCTIKNAEMIDANIISIVAAESDTAVFAPEAIKTLLRRSGFTLPTTTIDRIESLAAVDLDEDLVLMQRVLRRFLRSTHVSEDVLKARTGDKAQYFVKKLLPALLKSDVLTEVPKAGTRHPHYKLKVTMQEINKALATCKGDFKIFLQIIHGDK